MARVVRSGHLSYGPISREFEDEFAQLHHRKFGVLSNSGTSSLVVAIGALKELYQWPDGAEIICPALTFVATINAVLQNNLKPVLVDVDPYHYDLTQNAAKRAITDKTVAILVVDLFGQAPELYLLRTLCDQYNLKLIEDACEAMLVDEIGLHSDVAVFSFYMAHILTAGVGGIAICDDPPLARLMRSLVNHGINTHELPQGSDYDPTWLGRNFHFMRVGHSFRITEIEATIALYHLKSIRDIISARQGQAAHLNRSLAALKEVYQLPWPRTGTSGSWMVYPIVLRQGDRDNLMAYLRANRIECRTMMPLTNQPYLARLFCEGDYPVAQNINRMGLYVGCHQDITREQTDHLITCLNDYAREFIA